MLWTREGIELCKWDLMFSFGLEESSVERNVFYAGLAQEVANRTNSKWGGDCSCDISAKIMSIFFSFPKK